MEPRQETIRQTAFAIGIIAFGLSIALFLVDLATLHLAMAFRTLAPALLQAFSLFLFYDSHLAARRSRDGKAPAKSAALPGAG